MNLSKLFTTICLFLSISCFSQNISETVRGTITDRDSKLPLIGAQVVVLDMNPLKGTTTDENGNFRLDKIAIGRITLQVTYLGYEQEVTPNISVLAGKETIVNISLRELLTQIDEVVIKANDARGESVNEMGIVSTQSISPEQTMRYAGGFNDPGRILSNFAGVNNSQDGSADIIVRGNSPKYMQWRLEGMPIASPNHFADQSGLGTNGVSALNNNVLATSDFSTGAFAPEYGDAISGVYDVKFRTGNNEKFEAILGAGILGTDLSLEGPLSKNHKASFIANYRFSTTTILDKLGALPDIGGVPTFSDGMLKLSLPTDHAGTFTLYSLAGSSLISFEDVDASIWDTAGDRGSIEGVTENYEKRAHLVHSGITHMLPLKNNSYLQTSVLYSNESIRDVVVEIQKDANDNAISERDNFRSKITNDTWRASALYNLKVNARNTFQLGSMYSILGRQYNVASFDVDQDRYNDLALFNERVSTLRSYFTWKFRLLENVSFVSGVHNMNVLYNKKSTIEPRVAMVWTIDPKHSLRIGYGSHSAMESVHNYFARVQRQDGTWYEPNRNLGLLRANHYVLGLTKALTKNLSARMEFYYQDLYNLPVENNPNSSYATLNETIDFRYVELVNKGTGRNYGVEATIEKYLAKGSYFMINASIFDSKYKALDGVERNTSFNNNYLVNILGGKEFSRLGKKQNRSFGVNGKVFFGGGKRIIPLLRDSQGNLDVDPANGRLYDFSKSYDYALDNLFTLTLSMSYKWYKENRTNELFLNADNITNSKPRLSEFYSPKAEGKVGYLTPLGVFPNIMYRLYF